MSKHGVQAKDGKTSKKKWIILAVVLIVFFVIVGSNSGGSDTADSSTDSSQATDETSEPSFSADEAMKALTVACSNGLYASDVYMEDGNTIDPDKMHTYDQSQTGGYLYGSNYDDSYAVDENTWHIDGLILGNYENGSLSNYEFDVSGDVSFDGENYLVSNVTMEYTKYATDENGDIDAWGNHQTGTWCENEFSDEPFEVSPTLIEDDD